MGEVLHTREAETPQAKARWFQSLPLERRMELLCEYTELFLTLRPDIAEKKPMPTAAGRVCVLTKEKDNNSWLE